LKKKPIYKVWHLKTFIKMGVDKSFSWIPQKLTDFKNLNITIVGGTGGLGRAIAGVLASAGVSVTVIGRTFRDSEKKNIKFIKADLTSIVEAKKVAKDLDASSIDVLLFTTGIFAAPKREETSEGLERDMAVSFLNRLAMIPEIVPRMQVKKNSFGFTPRVFIMAYPGDGHLGTIDDLNSEKSYGAIRAHMNTVAGNEALVYDSVAKYHNVHFYGLNPGLVKTGIRNNLLGEGSLKSKILEGVVGWLTKTPEQYAQSIAPLLVAKELENRNGTIYNSQAKGLYPSKNFTPEYASEFIKKSMELLRNKNLA
jgi:NAD(P)-dependent dehydrogenase (short-subunit alcohol dehydrogenase family)